jgi:hypothetical protein
MEPGDSPGFCATDMHTGRSQPLDQLSSGTKLQLLLAVRVAFVEMMEQGVRLPLVLDETLGNSDEDRARAFIDALIELSRDGRQIFYFTAQHDEVGKWEAALSGAPEISFKIINLAGVRGLADTSRLPLPAAAPAPPPVPAPDGMTRQQYAALLGVPAPDWRGENMGGTHLWHAIDDLSLLHRLLTMHISTWGALKNFLDVGGARLFDDAQPALVRARAAGAALEEMARLRRIGRGKPVTRDVLLDLEVSKTAYIDRVCELAATLNGDAKALIASLQNKEIKGFREATFQKLRDDLESDGYLDPRVPLDNEQILHETLSACAQNVAAGRLTADRVEELLASMPT